MRQNHSHGGSVCSERISGRPNGGSTQAATDEDGGTCEGGLSGTALGGTPRGRPIHHGTNGDVFCGGRYLDELTGNKIPVRHRTRPEMHAHTDNSVVLILTLVTSCVIMYLKELSVDLKTSRDIDNNVLSVLLFE